MEEDSVQEVKVTETNTPTGTVQTKTVSSASNLPASEFFVSKANQIIFTFIGIINLLLLLRFTVLLLGANQVGIVNTLLSVTQIFVKPFIGIFPASSTGGSYFDTASIVAIVAYMVLGVIIGVIINLFSNRTAE